jgi:hypothetical protein
MFNRLFSGSLPDNKFGSDSDNFTLSATASVNLYPEVRLGEFPSESIKYSSSGSEVE